MSNSDKPNKTVLIIDDDELVARSLQRMFKGIGRQGDFEYCLEVVGHAVNVREGIKEALGKKPDIVFCDIQMPGGLGSKLWGQCEEMRDRTVFMSGGYPASLNEFIEDRRGEGLFLDKPFNMELVRQTILKVLSESVCPSA